MLYQPPPRRFSARRLVQVIARATLGFASLFRGSGDQAYLDGMRPSELEDIGLRRSQDGGYRPFD